MDKLFVYGTLMPNNKKFFYFKKYFRKLAKSIHLWFC